MNVSLSLSLSLSLSVCVCVSMHIAAAELLESANTRLRSKCVVVIASVVQCSKSLCIPFLGTVIPRLLQLMTATQSGLQTKPLAPADGHGDDNDDDMPLLYLCCLQNLARVLKTLAGLLSPYLEQIVAISATVRQKKQSKAVH